MTPNSMATGRAVETNGIGKTTSAHLNLTRSMADVAEADAFARELSRKVLIRRRPWRPRSSRQYAKIAYAGREEIAF